MSEISFSLQRTCGALQGRREGAGATSVPCPTYGSPEPGFGGQTSWRTLLLDEGPKARSMHGPNVTLPAECAVLSRARCLFILTTPGLLLLVHVLCTPPGSFHILCSDCLQAAKLLDLQHSGLRVNSALTLRVRSVPCRFTDALPSH